MGDVRYPQGTIRDLLYIIGDDPDREGLRETPDRVLRAYEELFSGYDFADDDIGEMLKVFEDGACDEMVMMRNIDLTSWCEHHLMPFHGVAHVAYIPDGKVVGISKLARLVDVYSRRLQIQERLTQQITHALQQHLQPKGAACVIEAHHECMSCRGVKKNRAEMATSSLVGAFMEASVRQEFFSLVARSPR